MTKEKILLKYFSCEEDKLQYINNQFIKQKYKEKKNTNDVQYINVIIVSNNPEQVK